MNRISYPVMYIFVGWSLTSRAIQHQRPGVMFEPDAEYVVLHGEGVSEVQAVHPNRGSHG